MTARLLACAAAACFLALAVLPAVVEAGPRRGAKTTKAAVESTQKQSVKSRIRKIPKLPPIQHLEGDVYYGKPARPEVQVILGRADHRYRPVEAKKSFVDQIGKSVESPGF